MPKWDINFDYCVNLGDRELLEYIVKAEAHRQITCRIPIPPGMAKEIDKINIIRQIKGTTGLEGNPLTEEEIKRIVEAATTRKQEKGSAPRKLSASEIYNKEVENAYEVQQFIRNLAHTQDGQPIITEDLIKELHYLTTKDIPSELNVPGQYRTSNVKAGTYIPPDPDELEYLMRRFVEIINDRELLQGMGPLIRAIVAHFYLISIHPFGDGNGRTSRALEAYILYQSRYNARGFYSLANYFYRNREQYVQELDDARFKYNADLTSFVKFALKGFVEEIEDVQQRILNFVRETMFLSYVEELYAEGVINARAAAILEHITEHKETISLQMLRDRRTPFIQALYEKIKTNKTIKRDIEMMKNAQLLLIDEKGILRPNIAIMDQFEG